jgi:hypothetical protein
MYSTTCKAAVKCGYFKVLAKFRGVGGGGGGGWGGGGESVNFFQFEISSSHGGEYDVQSCLLGYTAV